MGNLAKVSCIGRHLTWGVLGTSRTSENLRMRGKGMLMMSLLGFVPTSLPVPEDELRRVQAGDEYQNPGVTTIRKGRKTIFGDEVAADKHQACSTVMEDTTSLHNFITEDIEKIQNISMSDYSGQVLLVVNLASF